MAILRNTERAAWLGRCTVGAAASILLLVAYPAAGGAQDLERPELPAVADTSDPIVYMRLGDAQLRTDPGRAEQAFFWASRLAPGAAEPLYGRFAAHLLANPDRLVKWMGGNPRELRSDEMVALDSLYWKAMTLRPFQFWPYERVLFDAYLQELMVRMLGPHDAASPDLEYALQRYLRDQGPELNGWLAYTERRFSDAIGLLNRAVRRSRDRASARWNLALALYQNGDLDGTLETLREALADREKQSRDKLAYAHQSSASYEYAIGWVHERKSDPTSAREAYARALLSDLAFYPAHMRMGSLALLDGDTLTALNSFKLSVDVQPDDAWTRYVYGHTLLEAGRLDEAVAELEAAADLESVFAAPHYDLARAAELRGDTAGAILQYTRFLERVSRSDAVRAVAQARLRALGGV